MTSAVSPSAGVGRFASITGGSAIPVKRFLHQADYLARIAREALLREPLQ